MTDYVAEAITAQWGERCPEFAEGCACCEAWRQYDRLREVEERACEILKPFAEVADYYDPPEDSEHGVAWAHDLTLSSLRRARSFLRESLPTAEGEKP